MAETTSATDISNGIPPEELMGHHRIGFKLIPLGDDGVPTLSWTSIYGNPNYWTAGKLGQDAHNFKNVATTFGKTGMKDDHGHLYLYALDIDSEGVSQKLIMKRSR
jgi:hypothetical protein